MFDRYYVIDARKLERLLIMKGWSLTELALHADMSERRLQKLMKGGQQVFRANLKRIADQFGIEPHELIESGPHSSFDSSTSRSPFTVEADGLPEDFDPTSLMVNALVCWLRNKVGGSPLVVDFDEAGGKIKLTLEVNSTSLKELFNVLYQGLKGQVQIIPPDQIPQGAGTPFLYLLWFTEAIRFPEDCPYEYLRGRVVTPENGFKIVMPEHS